MIKKDSQLEAVRKIVELARTGVQNPAQALRQMNDVLSIGTALQARLERGCLATQIIVPQAVGTVTVANTGITGQTGVPVEWTRHGWCVGVTGVVLSGPDDAGKVSVSIRINGDINLITNGLAQDYTPISTLAGAGREGYQSYFPLKKRVSPQDKWFVDFTSDLPIPGSGSTTYTAKLAFLFEADE